ncbi:MAG: hypothetical protein AAGJ28_00135 [Pseudomonadota bacterium]
MIPPILALFSWPFLVYLFCRNRAPAIALLVAVLGGYLLLPERAAIDLPALYELNKVSIPAYTALILCMIMVSQAQSTGTTADQNWLPGWIPRAPLTLFLVVITIIGAIMTVVTNPDPIIEHGVTNHRRGIINDTVAIPGLKLRDAGATTLIVLVSIIPFCLARKFFAHPDGQRLLLLAFCVAGLIYTPLVLFEARMSPQLHNWTYGYHAHLFSQHVRADGFRPMIFLSHGLRVSIFLTATVIITIGLARLHSGSARMKFLALAGILLAALIISKSLGALMIAMVLIPLLLFAPRSLLMLAAAGIVGCMLIYPVLRGAGLVPVDAVLAFAEGISAERAQSFAYRLNFEDGLLAHTNERPLFGWGSWGRNLYLGDGVYAVPDGQWTLVLSQYGWVGFIGRFGLMFLPVVLILLNARRYKIGMESAVIAAALAVAAVDLIPNSGMTPDKWLLAGALWGRLELGRISDKAIEDPPALRLPGLRNRTTRPALAAQTPAAAEGPQTSRYTRQNRRIDRTVPTSPTTARQQPGSSR